jgi:molybdopterin synthase sulfur carrier subunit
MVKVRLGGTLVNKAGGRTEFEVEGANIMQMLRNLGRACPQLEPMLEKGVSVAIDGQIYRDAMLQPVGPENEIILLPRMAGG